MHNYSLCSLDTLIVFQWQGIGPGSYCSIDERRTEKDEDEQSSAATAGSTIDEADDDQTRGVPSMDWYYANFEDRREAEFQHQQAVFATQDPYGVTGTWMRIVNFLDYHDLFAFNFAGPRIRDDQERGPVTTAEAFRLIMLKLWVTRIEWPDEEEGQPEDWETVAGSTASSPVATRDDEPITPPAEHTPEAGPQQAKGKETGETAAREPIKSKYPIVHFAGSSRSLHIRWDPNANSHIRGKSTHHVPIYSIHSLIPSLLARL